MEEHKTHIKVSRKKSWIPYAIGILTVLVLINMWQVASLSSQMGTTGRVVADDSVEKVTIIEFSDFECPYCGKGASTINQVKEAYGDKVEVIFKNFPLSFHPNAQKAAEAAECAREQGKFWEMHDLLFENQRTLGVENYKKWAGELGLKQSEFDSCLDSGKMASKVTADFNEGRQKGVRGTPAFFVNGEMISGAQPFDAFKAVVDRALSGEAAPAPAPTPAPQPAAKVDVKIDDDDIKGDPDAPVTIIEFSDYECPYCGRHYSQTMPQIIEKYVNTGKVNLVFKDFPLAFHSNAQKASEAAECAGDQDKYWEMHDILFDNQKSLSVENYKLWAGELDLDQTAFDNCLDTGKYEAEVKKDMAEGQAAGITGTPGFFVNGKQIKGAQPYAVFEQAIEEALAE